MNKIILEMKNITQDFPGVRALDNVNLSVRKGEVMALVGENGAGKSTLMKILSGVYPYPDYSGEIYIKGKKKRFKNTKEAKSSGISIIHQELNLVLGISVGENIFLGREPLRQKWGFIDWEKLFKKTEEILKRLKLKVLPRTLVSKLTVGEQQLVEIAKALSQHTEVLILDEPTSALTKQETEQLFNIIGDLKKEKVTMIYISHKLEEIFQVTDRIAVLRDGKNAGTDEVSRLNRDKIVSMMVGREIKDMYPKEEFQAGEIVLEVKNYSVEHPYLEGRKVLKNINFKARKGEILGIAGLMGSGRTALVTSLFGSFPVLPSGKVYIDGKSIKIRSPHDAINNGLALVTEDRKLLGLVLSMSVGQNLSLSMLEKISRFQVIDKEREKEIIDKYISELRIKTPSSLAITNNLSGGNQQKVVVGKWLATKPRILFLDEPTRGIDVGAKVEIYQIMNKLVKEGVVIIMISSELPEILGICDRILVMHEGEVTGELIRQEATQEKIMHLATGGK